MPTVRESIIELLAKREMDARELSRLLGIREAEVFEHLDHIAKSVTAKKRKFKVRPCRCRLCGYVFENRRRLSRPGRCPECKRSQLEGPTYAIL